MQKKPNIVAHRGGASLFPENTLAAFQHAISLGVDEVECDVHLLKSGEVVVFHDFKLEQLAGKQGEISEIDNTARQQLKIRGGNEAPPLLVDLLNILAPTNVRLHLEIKTRGETEKELLLAQKSLALIKEKQIEHQCSAISFDPASLKPFIEAGIPSGPCIDKFDGDMTRHFDEWKSKGFRDLSLNASQASIAFVEKAIEAGFIVGLWTVNGPARLSHWLNVPVQYITTDQPDLALKLRQNIFG